MIYVLVLKVLGLTFSAMGAYYAHIAVTNSSRDTTFAIRISLVTLFVANCGVMLSIFNGNQPDWLVILLLAGCAVKLSAERRRTDGRYPMGGATRRIF